MSVFNGEAFLRESVDSVLTQTYRDFEFIVIDDGSSDETSGILQSYEDPRLNVIRQENRGLTAALNHGIRLAKGRYIARQDADDTSHPQRIEDQVRFLESHPEIALVGCWATLIDDEGDTIGAHRYPIDPGDIGENLPCKNQFIHGSLLMRTMILQEIGGYREQFYYAQDHDLVLRMIEKHRLANLPKELYSLRHWRGKISIARSTEQLAYSRLAKDLAAERRTGRPDAIDKGVAIENLLVRDFEPSELHYEHLVLFHCLRHGNMPKARKIVRSLIKHDPFNLKGYLQFLLTLLGRSLTPRLLRHWDRYRPPQTS